MASCDSRTQVLSAIRLGGVHADYHQAFAIDSPQRLYLLRVLERTDDITAPTADCCALNLDRGDRERGHRVDSLGTLPNLVPGVHGPRDPLIFPLIVNSEPERGE